MVQISKTGRRLWRVALLKLCLCSVALEVQGGQQVTLEWTASVSPTVVGYYLYYGTINGDYNNKVDAGTNTTYTVSGLAGGSTNYFTATSYNSFGIESSYVPEVSYIVPGEKLAVTAASASRVFGQANPVFTGTIIGLQNGDEITAAYSCGASDSSPVGTYAITPTLVDPGDAQTNYTVSLVNGALTVTQAAPLVTWSNPAAITYGATLNFNQLNATANVPGSFSYSPASGAALNAGTHTLSVVFTPGDTVDYSSATASVSLVVSPATLTVTASNASRLYSAANPVFSGTITGLQNGDNITATYNTTATVNSPVGTYVITPTLVDPGNRQANYNVSLLNSMLTVTQFVPSVTWTNPVPIIYGATLTSNQLNATANAPGSFAYVPTSGTALNVGTNTLSVVFTPTDTVDYGSATARVSVVILPAPLTVIAANASRLYGAINPVFAGTINGLQNGDEITATYSTTATANSTEGTYPITPTLLDPKNSETNYTVSLVSGTLTVTQTAQSVPLVTWTSPAPIIYGATLDSNQLNATANVPGSFAYTPTKGTALNVGINALSVIFTPTDMLDYSSATASATLVVSPAPLTVAAANASRVYGVATPVFIGTITGLQNGDNITATYSTTATTNSPVGAYPITPSLVDPNNGRTNYTVSLVNGTLTVIQAVPQVTWTNPASIIYGAALKSKQLHAHANVPGRFVYTPTNGATLNAGANTLSVIFTPTNSLDYSSVTASVSLMVSPAPLTVTAANASRLYGANNPVFTGTITGLQNGDDITAAYSCSAANNSPAGTYPITPSLVDPNNSETNYTVSLVSGTLTVTQSAQSVPLLNWTNPAPIIYGAALGSNQLNATANVPGSFAYTPTNGATLNAGATTLSVIFTPTDALDYSSATASVSLVVSPAPLTVTAASASRMYGAINPVFTGTITGLQNGDDITADYSCSATDNSPVGTYPITPSLADPNNSETNYTVSLVSGTLTVTQTAQSVPLLNWTNPAPIIYGAALGSNQLNATASVPGSFAYTPTNGAALNAGANALSVIFTPTDTLDYSSATASVSLVVSPAPLTVTAASASRMYGAINPVFTGTITGLQNGDDITSDYSCSATNNSPVGTYPITPSLADPNNSETNYTVSLVDGTLAVTQSAQSVPLLNWTNPAPIIYGAALGSNQLDATANVPGSFAYTPTNGATLNAGANALSVIFTPTDTLDYSSATASVSLVVSPAPLTVTAASASRMYGAINPVFTGTITGLQNGDDITADYSCSATNNSPAGTYPITPSLVDPDNSETNYTVSFVSGTLTVTGLPVIQTPTLSSSSITFTWSTLPNQQYQIQSTTDLVQGNWTSLGGAITASNSTMIISEPIGGNAQQFYRIVLLQ